MLLALTACEPTAPAGDSDARAAPPVTWVVPPAPGGFPLGAVKGRLGRSQPPQPLVDVGIARPASMVANTANEPTAPWTVSIFDAPSRRFPGLFARHDSEPPTLITPA